MLVSFEKLVKILSLEKGQDYRDRAVIGGLDKFLQTWHNEARAEAVTEAQKATVADVHALLSGYAQRERGERMQAVQAALERLHGMPAAVSTTNTGHLAEPAQTERAPDKLPEEDPRLNAPLEQLRGVSKIYARRLARLGAHTIRDLLYLFPTRYDDFGTLAKISELWYGQQVTVAGVIKSANTRTTQRNTTVTTITISDGTGTVQATWFNQPFLEKQLQPGRRIVLSGRVDEYLGRLVFSSPEWEPLQTNLLHTGRLVPVYPLTEGLTARWLRRLMHSVVEEWAGKLVDPLPADLRQQWNLTDLISSIRQIHFPDSKELLDQARRRLAFEEFLLIQLGVLRQRRLWEADPGQPLAVSTELVDAILAALPFPLTGAQKRSLDEILSDLPRPHAMSRLLQGDVGSGKTVVAVTAMLVAVANGAQAAIMAPTEILAEQHYRTINELLSILQEASTRGGNGQGQLREVLQRASVRLLTGSVPKGEKSAILQEIEQGEAMLIVGTHALIQEGVNFRNLGLVIVDEQHRFGVNQRAALRQKGYNPHMLVMSATPIPRSLALTIYGDLDISVIDELPPNRQAVETRWLMPSERERAYAFLRHQVAQGRQAFVICPLVEESEKSEAKAAVSEYEYLRDEVFPQLRLGMLHGRMKSQQKEETMAAFKRGELDILVSTAVVEVGIDVPNATVMLVEGANRFGLAQLHQFRGRVGRGAHKSYCLLIADTPTVEAEERLKIIEQTQDGFLLAEEDLKMRGPGEFFGTRQSGLPNLRVARLSDMRILEEARETAASVFAQDPELQEPRHRPLAEKVDRFWQPTSDLS